MALSYKTRRRLSLLVLVVGLPVYIGLAWYIVSLFERPSDRR
jgi:peptidoglycan/LPS O-acetylase OafA/YrhL